MKPLSTPCWSTAALRLGFLSALVFLAGSAQAHPGHGLLEHGFRHTLTNPIHLATLAIGGVTLLGASMLVRRHLPRRVVQSLGVIFLLASVILLGIRG